MATIRHGNCVLSVDVEATRAAYEQLAHTDCTCDGCKNFTEAMPALFVPSIVAWFSSLGIDYRKPGEVFHLCREDSGLHLYGGWYHGIGSLEGRCEDSLALTEDFEVSFHDDAVCLQEPFKGRPVVQIEISTRIPWVIREPEMDLRRKTLISSLVTLLKEHLLR